MADPHLKHLLSQSSAPAELKSSIDLIFKNLQSKTFLLLKKKYKKELKNKQLQKSNKNTSSKSMQITESQSKISEDSTQKQNKINELIQKLQTEKKQRHLRQQQREKKQNQKLFIENQLLQQSKQEANIRAEESKRQYLKDLKEKSLKRKEQIQELNFFGNREYRKVLSSKPMHKKIEEDYFNKIIMPEFQRHKSELAKKRELFQPINRSEIVEHARFHDQMIQEHHVKIRNFPHEKAHNTPKYRSKYTYAYMEDMKKNKEKLENLLMIKRKMTEKKKHYAELVLEMYRPIIDPAKQLEMNDMRKKIETSSAKSFKKITDGSSSAKDLTRDYSSKEYRHKVKWKKKPMVFEIEKKRVPVKIDWLAERREERERGKSCDEYPEDYNWDRKISSDRIIKKVRKLEEKIRKEEIKLEVVSPVNIKGVKDLEQVNQMLIDSIKGKLAILEKPKNHCDGFAD